MNKIGLPLHLGSPISFVIGLVFLGQCLQVVIDRARSVFPGSHGQNNCSGTSDNITAGKDTLTGSCTGFFRRLQWYLSWSAQDQVLSLAPRGVRSLADGYYDSINGHFKFGTFDRNRSSSATGIGFTKFVTNASHSSYATFFVTGILDRAGKELELNAFFFGMLCLFFTAGSSSRERR